MSLLPSGIVKVTMLKKMEQIIDQEVRLTVIRFKSAKDFEQSQWNLCFLEYVLLLIT